MCSVVRKGIYLLMIRNCVFRLRNVQIWVMPPCKGVDKLLLRLDSLPLCERLATWKRDSWASANRPSCTMVLLIFERSATWKRVSLVVANRPPYKMELPKFQRHAAGKRHPEHHKIKVFSFRQWPYLNISQPESAILQNQKTDPLQICTAHIWKFHSFKKYFLNISKSTLLQDCTALIWTFRSLKMPFLTISK